MTFATANRTDRRTMTLYFGDFYIGDIFINETGYTKELQK